MVRFTNNAYSLGFQISDSLETDVNICPSVFPSFSEIRNLYFFSFSEHFRISPYIQKSETLYASGQPLVSEFFKFTHIYSEIGNL